MRSKGKREENNRKENNNIELKGREVRGKGKVRKYKGGRECGGSGVTDENGGVNYRETKGREVVRWINVEKGGRKITFEKCINDEEKKEM